MNEYLPGKDNPNKKIERNINRKVHAEAELALRSSLEIHGKTSANAANDDLTLNPLSASPRSRMLTPDRYERSGSHWLDDDVREKGFGSAIDDVVSGGTWQTSSYLGPKRNAFKESLDDFIDEDSPKSLPLRSRSDAVQLLAKFEKEFIGRPYAVALGAAGAGFLLARMISGRA